MHKYSKAALHIFAFLLPFSSFAGDGRTYEIWSLEEEVIPVSRQSVMLSNTGPWSTINIATFRKVKCLRRISLKNGETPSAVYARAEADKDKPLYRMFGPSKEFGIFSRAERVWYLVRVETAPYPPPGSQFLIAHAQSLYDKAIVQIDDAYTMGDEYFTSTIMNMKAAPLRKE